jgi:hypothetical protein
MDRVDRTQSCRYGEIVDLERATLPGAFRPAIKGLSVSVEQLPHYVEESLAIVGSRSRKDIEIFRNLLTIKVPVESLLQEVAASSDVSISEIPAALCRICNAWVEVAPQHDVAARMPISYVVGRLVDLWVSHRDANLSDDERRTIPSNEATREGFVKNDLTAKALFDAISRLSAPAMLAAGSIAQRRVERIGRVTMIGQDPFKVFFDTLFVFDPEKANVNKSTSEQFIPYLWSRLEARWLGSDRKRCEDKAVRSVRGREGELTDMASMLEDKGARDFTASVDRRDEFEWTRAALENALVDGALRRGDYEAILQYFGLGGAQTGHGALKSSALSIKTKAQRGIDHFKRYLKAQEAERDDIECLSSQPGDCETFARYPKLSGAGSHPRLMRRAEQRAQRPTVW